MSQTLNELGVAGVVGTLQGAVYALVALGIVLVYRASGVFNLRVRGKIPIHAAAGRIGA